jgi:hypothetical protein
MGEGGTGVPGRSGRGDEPAGAGAAAHDTGVARVVPDALGRDGARRPGRGAAANQPADADAAVHGAGTAASTSHDDPRLHGGAVLVGPLAAGVCAGRPTTPQSCGYLPGGRCCGRCGTSRRPRRPRWPGRPRSRCALGGPGEPEHPLIDIVRTPTLNASRSHSWCAVCGGSAWPRTRRGRSAWPRAGLSMSGCRLVLAVRRLSVRGRG